MAIPAKEPIRGNKRNSNKALSNEKEQDKKSSKF